MALFEWAALTACVMPELEALFHIPNGGKRGKAEAARFQRMGVKRGVPDICLAVSRGGKHGLFIELKRTEGGRLSPEQTQWLARLKDAGYEAVVCHGWDEARETIVRYLMQGE